MRRERTDPDRRIWECLACGGINVWNWQDAERVPGSAVAHGSCFDNVCGHCGADIVRADSPILATCYSHIGE